MRPGLPDRQGARTRTGGSARSTLWLAALAAGVVACQVEWGGGEIALEDPAPPPDSAAAERLEPEQIPLSPGPHLFAVRLDASGAARAVPLATIGDTEDGVALAAVSIPESEDPTFRARFDSTYLAPGRELDLLARGVRIGTLVLDGVPSAGGGACPSIATGQALVAPGQDPPAIAFAVPSGVSGFATPRRAPPLEPNRSMNVAGPVLAERLIGGDRAFLAQRAAMSPVETPGDTLPGMAATYLIADSLAPGPPGTEAVSLFFLARFEPAEGFIPLWQEVRRYGEAAGKEAFEYVDWIRLGVDRIDVLRRYDGTSTGFALGVARSDDAEREVTWVEPAGCDALGRLGQL